MRNAFLVFLSMAIGALFLEFGLRAVDGVTIIPGNNFVADTLAHLRTPNLPAKYDAELGWRLRDNFPPPFTTGELGVRMNTLERRAVPRSAIVAVGDSFTAGSDVDNHETWPAQLEQKLRRPVVNSAVGGYGVDQIVLRAEEVVRAFNPEILLVGILSHDSLRNSFELFGGMYKPYFSIENGALRLHGQPTPHFTPQNDLGLYRAVLGYSYLVHWTMLRLGLSKRWLDDSRRYRAVHDPATGVEISCFLLDRLKALGPRLLVIMQYDALEALESERPWYATRVLDCAKQKQIAVIDGFEALRDSVRQGEAAYKALWVMTGTLYGHMSAKGNALIAEMIERALRS